MSKAVETKILKDIGINDQIVTSVDETKFSLSSLFPAEGAVISANLSVAQHKIIVDNGGVTVLSGSYFQSNSPDGVYNFSGRNSFLQAEVAWPGGTMDKSQLSNSYGVACTGAKGFPILSIDVANSKLKLSGDISDISRGLGKAFSYAFSDGCGTSCMTLLSYEEDPSLSAGWATFNTVGELAKYASYTEESCVWRYWNDDNGLYCPIDPSIGNTVLDNFYGNHAEGGSTKAIGKYTHAEGRKNTADIRYAHAEGSHNFAGGMMSHAEGGYNVALGARGHVEGSYNTANGADSHAAGSRATALANNQFVWSNGSAYGSALSAKTGSFCINPTGGLSGFYIGAKSLQQHLTESGSATIKSDLKSALSSCFDGVSDPDDVDTSRVIAALSALWLKVK